MIGLARPLCVDPAGPKALLAGELDEAPRWERGLRLGPGPPEDRPSHRGGSSGSVGMGQKSKLQAWISGAVGPASGSRMLRGFNHQASVAWFYRQILALADGRDPDTRLTARRALARHLRDELRLSMARRRFTGNRPEEEAP